MFIQLTTFDLKLEHKYHKFSEKAWGKSAYQASSSYFTWMYDNNPSGHKKPEDFLVLKDASDDIIGCIHKLRQPWLVHGEKLDIPATHNFYVLEAYRGCGAQLQFEAFKAEAGIFVPGCNEKMGSVYRKFKNRYQEIEACWYRKPLKPISGFAKYIKNKYLPKAIAQFKLVVPLAYQDVKYSTGPDPLLLEQLLNTYNTYTQDFAIKQYYDAVWFNWRFFHPAGPRHILVYRANAQGLTDFMVVSVGQHCGLRVARIIEAAFRPESFPLLHQAVLHLLRLNQVDMLAIFSADPHLNASLQNIGYYPIKKHPLTFVYYHNKQHASKSYRINAAAGDFGLDAIRRIT